MTEIPLHTGHNGRTTTPASWWNENPATRVGMLDLRGGAGVTVQKQKDGQLVAFDNRTAWRHPWNCTMRWQRLPNRPAPEWTVEIIPGFVNGRPPIHLWSAKEEDRRDLLHSNSLPLPQARWRRLSGTPPVHTFPRYFERYNVENEFAAASAKLSIEGESVKINESAPDSSTKSKRFLWGCDLWVTMARPTLKLFTDIPGNLVTGQIVEYSVGWDTSALQAHGPDPRLLSGIFYPQDKKAEIADRLQGRYDDTGIDQLRIATLYLLSPPDPADPESPPDASFLWFAEHHQFWNLAYASQDKTPKNFEQLPVGALGWFVGRYAPATVGMIGAGQAAADAILTAAMNESNEGRFWTV